MSLYMENMNTNCTWVIQWCVSIVCIEDSNNQIKMPLNPQLLCDKIQLINILVHMLNTSEDDIPFLYLWSKTCWSSDALLKLYRRFHNCTALLISVIQLWNILYIFVLQYQVQEIFILLTDTTRFTLPNINICALYTLVWDHCFYQSIHISFVQYLSQQGFIRTIGTQLLQCQDQLCEY
jgi:hypothetical protein